MDGDFPQAGFLLQTPPFIYPLLFSSFPIPPLPLLGPFSSYLAGVTHQYPSGQIQPYKVYKIRVNFLKLGDFTYKYRFPVSLGQLGSLARWGWGRVEATPLQGPRGPNCTGPNLPPPSPALPTSQPSSATYRLRDLRHIP